MESQLSRNDVTAQGRPWLAALPAPDFVSLEERGPDFLAAPLLARGAITLVFAPRGVGKSHVAHALAVAQARAGRRVLLADRDNSAAELRRRLRAWGAAEAAGLRVLPRHEAPPLTDAAAWRGFPRDAFDLVVLDSLDAFAEGVGEQDSARASRALAPLLDLVRACELAVLILGNTIKSGEHSRGSGVVEDRADAVFEARDVTGWVPSGTRAWWANLPAAGVGAWSERAARRGQQARLRLAFVPTKVRLGPEPAPFALEVDFEGTPWRLRDVTDAVLAEGGRRREEMAGARDAARARAAEALAALVAERAAEGTPLRVGAAEEALVVHGIGRNEARAVIRGGAGTRWQLVPGPGRGNPQILLPADGGPAEKGGEKAESQNGCDFADLAGDVFRHPSISRMAEKTAAKSVENSLGCASAISAADQLALALDIFDGARLVPGGRA